MDETKIRKIVQDEMKRNQGRSRFGLQNTQLHAHTGSDGSVPIKQSDVVPSVSVSGRIEFARATTYTLNLNSSFTPSNILAYGVVVNGQGLSFTVDTASATLGAHYTNNGATFIVATTLVSSTPLLTNTGTGTPAFTQRRFTVTAANATAGAKYRNNGHTYTVAGTIAGGTTLITNLGSGTPAPSGTLTKLSGTGDATITFSNTEQIGTLTKASGGGDASIIFTDFDTSGTPTFRALTVGSANLGPSFYFQPESSSSVQTGKIQYPFTNPGVAADGTLVPVQSSSYISVQADPAAGGVFHALASEGHIVSVEFSGIHARATVVGFSKTSVIIDVPYLDDGWSIIVNYIIT